MFPSNAVGLSSAPRRFVDKRGNQTTVTRKSATARIATLPRVAPETLQIPLETVVTAEDPTAKARFSLSPAVTPRQPIASKHGRRHRTLDFESPESSGDESDSSYNSFILSLKKKDILGLDKQISIADPLDRTFSNRNASPNPSLKSSHGSHPATYRVLKSHYEGDLFRNSKLNAQLIVGPDKQPGQPDYSKPLFTWVHLENPEMNFGAYIECVARCPYLNDSERYNVSSVLRTAREKSDRSLRMPSAGMTSSYIEPEYFEETIENTTYQGPRSKRTSKETVRWIAIPYFRLTQASNHSNRYTSGHGPELRPQSAKKGCVSDGDFFEVAQLWCVILGFMISCTRMPISDNLPEKLINLTILPPADPARPLTGDRAPMLQVFDGGLRLWLLPLDQCETWPAFVAHFVSLGVSLMDGWQVKYRDVVLDSNDWNTVIAMAGRTTIRLELCRKGSDESDDDNDYVSSDDSSEVQGSTTTPTVQQIGGQTQTNPSIPQTPFTLARQEELSSALDGSGVKPATQALQVDEFHVFTLLATVPITPPSSTAIYHQSRSNETSSGQQYRINEQQLQQDLSEVDDYLNSKNTRHMECVSYAECPKKASYNVEDSMSRLAASDREEYNNKKTFVGASRDIFELFCPLRYEHPMTLKFWGSVDRIVLTKGIKSAQGQFRKIVKEISILARIANEIRVELFSEKELSDFMTTVPHEFIQAWMLVQMYLVCVPTEHSSKSAGYLRRCKERLQQGRLKMLERLQPVNIHEREAVLPLGLTILLLGQLLHDSQGPLTPERHRLASSYWTLFKDLKAEVHDKPLNRKYESTFSTLKSEFETIVGTLEDQQRVLIALEDSINEAESHSFAYSSSLSKSISMEPSHEASITEYLLHQTAEMLQNFLEMSRRLNELEQWHFLCLSIDNDMQQKASFAFTTVTVFFLPLTTLTGILGMNTSDIRNMNDSQWIFWAVAIPLCLFCLSVWFVYLGSFERAWRWRKRTKRGD